MSQIDFNAAVKCAVHRAAAGRRCHLSKIFRPQVNATRRATVNGKGDCDEAEHRQSGQPRAPAANYGSSCWRMRHAAHCGDPLSRARELNGYPGGGDAFQL